MFTLLVSKMLYECRPKYHPTRIFIFNRMVKLSNWFGSSTFCVQTPCSVVTVRWLMRPESGSQKSWKKWTFCVCKNDWPNPLYIQVILALYRRQKTPHCRVVLLCEKEEIERLGMCLSALGFIGWILYFVASLFSLFSFFPFTAVFYYFLTHSLACKET